MKQKSEIMFDICTANNVAIHTVTGPSRSARLMKVRREIASTMQGEGYSVKHIAAALNRDSSAVRHMMTGKGWRR